MSLRARGWRPMPRRGCTPPTTVRRGRTCPTTCTGAPALIPHQIAVGPDGRVFMALDGNGVIVGTPPALPTQDAFADALGLSGTVGTLQRSTVGATKEAGEPDHAGNVGGRSSWFTWKPGATGNVTFDTAGSNFDTLLGVYTGSSVSGLTQVAANDNRSATDLTSVVTFNATKNVTYRIAVDGRDGASGNAFLNRSIVVTNAGYKPAISVASPMATTVLWQFVGPSSQRVQSTIGLFDSGVRAPGTTFTWTASTAGHFTYRSVSASMTGRVGVPANVSPSVGSKTTPFVVTWALSVPTGARFDVQVKRPGGAWQNWRTNVPTASASYTPGASAPAGTYWFQARIRLPGGVSGWSPPVTVAVS